MLSSRENKNSFRSSNQFLQQQLTKLIQFENNIEAVFP